MRCFDQLNPRQIHISKWMSDPKNQVFSSIIYTDLDNKAAVIHVSRPRNLIIKRLFYSRSPTPLRGEHEQLLGEGVEEDDEDSRLEAALRGELKAEAAKGEDSQVRSQKPFISTISLHVYERKRSDAFPLFCHNHYLSSSEGVAGTFVEYSARNPNPLLETSEWNL